MAQAGSTADRHALVRVTERARPPALYRIPFSLTMLGLVLIALQAGRPVLGFAVMTGALAAAALLAWRSFARRYGPAMQLRERADGELAAGRYPEARVLYERALGIAQRELPPAAPEVLVNVYSLAAVNSMLHDHTRADQYLERLLAGLDHRVPSAWAGHVAWLLRRIAHHHSLEGRHARAVQLCHRALDLVGPAPGADDNTVRSILDDLAWVHHHAGVYADAERLFREALTIHEHFRDTAIELAQRPSAPRERGESPYRVPGPAVASTSGGLDRAVAYSLLGLGWTVYERGRYDEARALFDRANLIAASLDLGTESESGAGSRGERSRAGSHLRVEILRGRAAVEMTVGRYADAQTHYRTATSLLGEVDSALQRAALAIDLGWLARSREHFDEAEHCYAEALGIVEGNREGTTTIACALWESMAELHRRQGRLREALRAIQRAGAMAEDCLGPEHPRIAAIQAIASRIHTARSELGEAERTARRCLAVLRAALGPTHVRFADGHVALGEVQLARGQLGAAEQAFARALELREHLLGRMHPELVEVLDGRTAVLRALGREEEAEAAAERAAEIRAAMVA